MSPFPEFPKLNAENHRITSPATETYNCIAWANSDSLRWWEPGEYWPTQATADEYGPDALLRMFASLGFIPADGSDHESGYVKVALYSSPPFYTHAARQLPTGKWTSKLGRMEDVEHDDPDALAGGVYGTVTAILKRPLSG